jgi:hypothetical protein
MSARRDVRTQLDPVEMVSIDISTCRVCGCTDLNCRGCIVRTGAPCSWVPELENDEGPICSACVDQGEAP